MFHCTVFQYMLLPSSKTTNVFYFFSVSEMVEFEVNQLFTNYCLRELRK